MTSIHFDPAQFMPPSEQEPRDQLIVGGRYSLPPIGDPTGKRRSLQRVTNFVKQLSDTAGLERWKLRMAVIGLARDERRYDLACSLNPDSERGRQELDKLIEECIDFGQAGPSGGNITGTALHNYTDDVAGSYPIRVRDKWVPKLENYQRALHDKGLRVVPGLQERLVVSERYGTCGRLDDVYEDPFGTLRVGDRKSQKEFRTWWEIGAQLALYQLSEAMWNEETCDWEDMPKLAGDLAHVAWMPLKHPNGATPRGSVDDVTIYDIPLDGPREVLEYCARVRELRTGARKWGAERPNLDAFAVTAREIRDAETHDDLRKIAACRQSGVNWDDDLHQPMVAKRWDELAALTATEALATPLNASVNMLTTSSAVYQATGANLATDFGVVPPRVVITVQREALQAWHPSVLDQNGTPPASMYGFDPALFVGPEQEEATFQGCPECSWATEIACEPMLCERHGRGSSGAVSVPGGADARGPALGVGCCNSVDHKSCLMMGPDNCSCPAHCPAEPSFEPRPELGMSTGWIDGEGALRKPGEWVAHLKLDMSINTDKLVFDPMTLSEFRTRYATEIALAEGAQRTNAVKFTHSKHENATTVHLPGDEPVATSRDDRETAIEALDSVPIKIVREVRDRAHNSKSSRGRVRLLNDVEENKYAAHGAALLPALLKEWLVIDGLNGEPGFNKDGVPRVANTGGSKREPMDARLGGRISLSEYLELKDGEASKSAPDAEATADEVRGDAPDASALSVIEQIAEKIQAFGDAIAEVRKPYAGLSEGPHAGKHSIARLMELAKDARNGAERAKVFRAITKYHTWTGEIAAEINQHYLDNGYATEDFEPYFEAKVIEGSALPLDPDDPGTVDDAIHLLEGVTTLVDLQKMWTELGQRPYFHDARLQEALMVRFTKVKA